MLHDLPYRITLLAFLVGGLATSAWLRRRADEAGGVVPRSEDPPGLARALRMAGGAYYASLLLWIVHPPLVGWAQVALPPELRWLGAVLSAAGVGLGVWSLVHLGRNVTPTSAVRSDARLVVTGPYRRVRHPLYTSALLSIPGFSLLSANLLVLAAGVATFAVLVRRTDREEAKLLSAFGEEYTAYAERTGRFLPRIG